MSNVKHTAGPWYVNTDPVTLSEYAICAKSRGKGFGSSVAVATQRDGVNPIAHDEAMANARLIAAAPELLEALKKYIAAGAGDTTSFYKQAEAYDAAIEAIAKAEGQS